MNRSIGTTLLVLALAGPANALLPAPDHIIYGTATADGVLVTSGIVTLELETTGLELARYSLGAVADYGNQFALRVAMDTGSPAAIDQGHQGDPVRIYLDGELAGLAILGMPGTAQELDIDPAFDDEVEVSVRDLSVAEADSGTSPAELEIRISRPLFTDVVVTWATRPGTATAGSDYLTAGGTVTIEAGEVQAFVSVQIVGDTTIEPPEHFFVDIASSTPNTVIPDPTGEVTIEADDAQWVVSVGNVTVLEGDGGVPVFAEFVVSAEMLVPEGNLGGPVLQLPYTTVNDTATAGSDYLAATGTVTIDTGVICPDIGRPCAVVSVEILPDNTEEPTETFFLDIALPTPNPLGIAIEDGRGTGFISSDERFLYFVETETGEGPACLDCRPEGPLGIALSPGGEHVYLGGSLTSSVVVLQRNSLSGELEPIAQVVDGVDGDGLGGVEGLVVSPDGAQLYTAAFLDDQVGVFDRDPLDGTLTFQQAVSAPNGPAALAISPDGAFVYAVSSLANTITVFQRAAGGALTPVQTLTHGVAGVQGLLGVRALAISLDGTSVYTAAPTSNAVSTFVRDPGTGQLTWLQTLIDQTVVPPGSGNPPIDGLGGAVSLAVSPEGSHLYVAGEADDSVAVLRREANGTLTWLQRRRQGLSGVSGMAGAAAVGVSGDGGYVFVASRGETGGNAIVAFTRDSNPGSSNFGRLTSFIEARYDGEADANGPVTPEGPQIDGLRRGSAMVLSAAPDGRHIYVVGTDDDAVAVFFKDTLAPAAPVFEVPSPSGHSPAVWSTEPNFVGAWNASDDPLGVGLAGYAVVFDTSPATNPGTTLHQLDDPGAPNQTYATTVPDSTNRYLHVVACDRSDNCSPPAHFGPLWVDATAPVGPTNLVSTSHPVGTPFSLSELSLQWTAASDALSGLLGYALAIDDQPATGCSEVLNIAPEDVSAVTTLPDGIWWAHLCARDVAGNWGVTSHAGPFLIDTTPPQVVALSTISRSEGGELLPNQILDRPVTQFELSLSEVEVVGLGTLDNYTLVRVGEVSDDGGATTCATADGGDLVTIDSLVIEPNGTDLTLRVRQPDGLLPLVAGKYRLLVCAGGLADLAGNALDGDRDGSGGDDLAVSFTVGRVERLRNPNLDVGAGEWSQDPPGSWLWEPEDAEAGRRSGSLRLEADFTTPASHQMAQCVPVLGGRLHALEGRARTSSPELLDPVVFARLEWFAAASCSGASLGVVDSAPLAGDTLGVWVELESLQVRPPSTAQSARVRYVVDGSSATTVVVDLDTLSFGEALVIFVDGFESGDASRWSVAVP